MNNKPVAWMVNDKIYQDIFEAEHYSKFTDKPMIPLYIHPVKELTPCEELRAFQEQQNGVFSDHNACCYRHECRIVWNDWEKLRSNPVELTDEEIEAECRKAWGLHEQDQLNLAEVFKFAKAILRKAQEK